MDTGGQAASFGIVGEMTLALFPSVAQIEKETRADGGFVG
jgi:hypothetical protein